MSPLLMSARQQKMQKAKAWADANMLSTCPTMSIRLLLFWSGSPSPEERGLQGLSQYASDESSEDCSLGMR